MTGFRSGGKIASYLSSFGIEPYQKLVRQGNTNDFLGFAGSCQPLFKMLEVCIMECHAPRDHKQNLPDPASPAAHLPFAFVLTAITGQRGQTSQFGNPLVG